jgi:hypothetical protein
MSKPYLSMCAIYKNEAQYLEEWLEFHRLIGVERFFLYNHGSTDNHAEILRPYTGQGTVVVHDWPAEMVKAQIPAYNDCLERHRDDSRWIAFIDIDEFLFSPTGRPVPEILVDYEELPGVGVNVVIYGTSGHVAKPDGLVIENYVRRRGEPPKNTKKVVLDPTRTSHCRGAHSFAHPGTVTSDENKELIYGPYTATFSVSRLRIHHYYTKSEQERREKFDRIRMHTGQLRDPLPQAELDRLSEVEDYIIEPYVDPVQAALRERRGDQAESRQATA